MSSFCSPRWWPWSRTCIGATGPMSVSISPESSPWCAEAQALPGALVSCTELVSSSAQVVPLVLMGIGFGSRESQGSPVSMTVNSSAQVGPLTLTGIGEWILLGSWVMSEAKWGHHASTFGP
ncbi:uncharacterized protein LOC129013542 isoform X3 [Pongo pygmaeus]|uniref:uncharacterized protein LOC129013542 isoform X3 n=1 Tax=Pongo pygmaeus TaxID=9600 RepID=UPI00300CF7E5